LSPLKMHERDWSGKMVRLSKYINENIPLVGGKVFKAYRKLSSPRPRPRKPRYEMNNSKLTVNHSCGIFSCYTIRLEAILDYYRTHKRVPAVIDCSQQFTKYKDVITD